MTARGTSLTRSTTNLSFLFYFLSFSIFILICSSTIMDPLLQIIEPFLIQYGYWALLFIVFAESGLFFGFFFPGDSLLFTAGLLASQGLFNPEMVWIGVCLAAITGDQIGYWTGKKFGKKLFNQPNSFFFNPNHIAKAEQFYEKHGKKTIILARFVPAVRTFAPIVAGIAEMDYKTFVKYNIIGGILWSALFVGTGFLLGSSVPKAGDYLTYLILVIVILSLVPIILEYLNSKKKTAQLTCPFCATKQTVPIPENQCLAFYDCIQCKKRIQPKQNNCCVICSYSDKQCTMPNDKK